MSSPTHMTLAIRLATRQIRASLAGGGATRVLLIALVIAVAAVTAVTRITDRVDTAIRAQGSQTLAADLKLTMDAPVRDAQRQRIDQAGIRHVAIATFPSAISVGERLQLVAVKAVGQDYPLRGQLTLQRGLQAGNTTTIAHGPAPGHAWVDQGLLDRVGLQMGDHLPLGNSRPIISGVIANEPDRSPSFIDFAPRVMIAYADMAATGLTGPGARIRYAELMAGAPGRIDQLKSKLSEQLAPDERLLTPAEANRGLASALDKAGLFLNLAALAAVVLAGVAVALASRQHAQSRLDEIALLKTLGAGKGVLRPMLAWQLALLGLVGLIIGWLIGEAAELGLGQFVHAVMGIDLPLGRFSAAWSAPLIAMALLGGFAWPAVSSALSSPPARVLSRAAAPTGQRSWPIYAAAVGATAGMAALATTDVWLTGAVLATIGIGAVLFAGGGWLLLAGLAWLRPRLAGRLGPGTRLGLDALLRRRAAAIVQCVALGLGLTLIFLLVVVRADLLGSWQASVADNAPNRFVINITPEQTIAVSDYLAQHDLGRPELYPIVRARLTAVNGKTLATSPQLAEDAGDLSRRALNVSWMAQLKADNRLTDGRWWQASDQGKPRVSLDQSIAQRLGVTVGDSLAFDIAGQSLTVTITSLRDIDWSSLQPNFYVLAPPGLLDNYPATLITGIFLPPGRDAVMAGLVQRFPNVTVIDLASLLAQIETLIHQVSLAVELVFGFTLAAGLVVLIAAQGAARNVRRREAAVLRALGARGAWLRRAVWVECLLVAATTTLLAGVAAQAGAVLIATQFLHLEYHIRWDIWAVAIVLSIGAIGLAGVLTLGRVMHQPAWTVLRAADSE